ncbi:MAG: Na+/H+ antiporter NhaA [Bacteroidales bacterium]|nr:Na+/H+ antiporter NhaA [Bacteroidales bacterium]
MEAIKKTLITPFQKFVKIESLSGILLFTATILALIWANSPISDIYNSIWEYKLGFSSQSFELSKPLLLWINDGLMAVFFFLIGLEIKRELLIGELNSLRKAAFPFFAAIGGIVVPVLLFLFLNTNPNTQDGWGIPMATDIAFTLAILQLLGKRVPLSLKVFLMAFAIVDDLGAVLVIALFYSGDLNWSLLLISLVLLLVLYFLAYKKIYSKYLSFIVAVIVWFLFLKSGIHPTIAGVLMAFSIPIRQKVGVKVFTKELTEIISRIKTVEDNDVPILTREQIDEIDNLEDWTCKVQSPLQHLEHRLHNWVAYFIMPLFAFANAGVSFQTAFPLDYNLIFVISISLFLGKSIGISLMSYLSVKLKWAELPDGFGFMQVIGVAVLAGVGFTMSIFIANLAFVENTAYVDSAKVGIIVGSFISALFGFALLFIFSTKKVHLKNTVLEV